MELFLISYFFGLMCFINQLKYALKLMITLEFLMIILMITLSYYFLGGYWELEYYFIMLLMIVIEGLLGVSLVILVCRMGSSDSLFINNLLI
uniref:NADH dehydrogenase subunit 4L n=1 Tax=Pseudogarypus banksi TaxID=1131925 RepID=H9MFJ0_9ARAC|nr:NADH dehydrogenase subunit 4L [Pseudogarypus banksi]